MAGERGQTRTVTDALRRAKRPDQRRELPRRLGGRSVVVANSLVSLRNCRPRRPQWPPARPAGSHDCPARTPSSSRTGTR